MEIFIISAFWENHVFDFYKMIFSIRADVTNGPIDCYSRDMS